MSSQIKLIQSCYLKIDFKIPETATVFEAINRMAENQIGALAVTEGSDPNNRVIGIFSERDYLCKIAILGTLISTGCTVINNPLQEKLAEILLSARFAPEEVRIL